MSANMCANVIEQFREFIYYKVNYIDPMIININFMMNCYFNTDTYLFNFDYNLSLESINNCVTSGGTGPECIQLCKEYKIGETSDMFIGNLSEYTAFIDNLDELIKDFDATILDDDYSITIDSETYSSEFFSTTNSSS